MASSFRGRFWRAAFGDGSEERAFFFVKAAAAIYLFREHVMELTVVRENSLRLLLEKKEK